MAMPASGSIAIISAPQTCGSISVAVTGSAASPPYSLTTLSTTVGKTAPHAMSEFYGYAPIVWKCVDMVQVATVGTCGTSNLVTKCLCLQTTPALSAGECYSATLAIDLCALGQAVGSCAQIRVTCGGIQTLCCITTNGCLTASPVISQSFGDVILICLTACAVTVGCAGNSHAAVCLSSITPIVGNECKGNTCTYSCVWSG